MDIVRGYFSYIIQQSAWDMEFIKNVKDLNKNIKVRVRINILNIKSKILKLIKHITSIVLCI